MKKTIAIIIGTRPEAIKMAPVFTAIQKSEKLTPVLWSTGQHRDMLKQTLAAFNISPDQDLDIMEPGQTLGSSCAKVIATSSTLLSKEKPDCVLVQGDTTSAFSVALSSFFLDIPVGHVEAGLRTASVKSPFPEEANRRLISTLSQFHFAPTDWALKNLLREGIAESTCWNTGNTVIDALKLMVSQVRNEPPKSLPPSIFERLNSDNKSILITGHRRENFGQGFESLCSAIRHLAERFPNFNFIYPVHLNPQVQEPVNRLLSDKNNILLCDPIDYSSFVYCLDKCFFILTDSGGIQEEAPHLGKPVLVMRESTERPEAVEAGTSRLVGTEFNSIVNSVSELIEAPEIYKKMASARNPYGDGNAGVKISQILEQELYK